MPRGIPCQLPLYAGDRSDAVTQDALGRPVFTCNYGKNFTVAEQSEIAYFVRRACNNHDDLVRLLDFALAAMRRAKDDWNVLSGGKRHEFAGTDALAAIAARLKQLGES